MMTSTNRRRVTVLEGRCPLGCMTCQLWFGVALRDDEGMYSRPEVCPDCGRLVPITQEVWIVGIPPDLI